MIKFNIPPSANNTGVARIEHFYGTNEVNQPSSGNKLSAIRCTGLAMGGNQGDEQLQGVAALIRAMPQCPRLEHLYVYECALPEQPFTRIQF